MEKLLLLILLKPVWFILGFPTGFDLHIIRGLRRMSGEILFMFF